MSFSLEAGELAFLTGRSGAGKSTLLKLIPAIERPSAGSVVVNGQNVGALKRAALPYLRRNIGLVFQDQKLLYDRSVYDNVMLPLAFSGACAQGSGAARARRARQGGPAGAGRRQTRFSSPAASSSASPSRARW